MLSNDVYDLAVLGFLLESWRRSRGNLNVYYRFFESES